MYTPSPYQILQPPGYVVMLFERMSWRQIPLDGRSHIPDNVRLWQGDSVGHWEGDTLVIDSTNFNGKAWLNEVGEIVSYAEHVVERITPIDADNMTYRATITDRWGLTPGSYALFVGRLVPEKAPDLLVRTWSSLPGDQRLVIVGGSSFTDDYVRALERAARDDPRVVLAGYVYGSQLEELYTNAITFILPSVLEGLPLTLLEAASFGTPIVASDIPPHLEVLGGEGPGHRIVARNAFQHRVDRCPQIGAQHQREGGLRRHRALGGK